MAETLRSRGNEVLFICRDDLSKSFKVLEDRLFKVILLPANSASSQISQEADADETIEALGSLRPSWLVVDSYNLDEKFEKKLREYVEKIAVIEDLANRRHDCDLLLDQNCSDRMDETFKPLVPVSCNFLIGPKYAMISSVFAKIREVSLTSRAELKRVFVFCGGADPKNLTKLVLDALNGDEFDEIKIDVVVGAQNHNFSAEKPERKKLNITFHPSGNDFAKIMSKADLAIGAGGTTTWERMCLGVPSIVVSIAENQVPTCEKLGREGLIQYLGKQTEVTKESVARVVREFLKTPTELSVVSIKSQILVDGKGCMRVAEAMCPSSESELKVRLATKDDCVDYFNWANDPLVREQSLNSAVIEWDEHQKWFSEKISSSMSEMYVVEASGLPVGQVRFELVAETAEINYSLDELVRGRSWAATAVDLAINAFRNRSAVPLRAFVKNQNISSRSTFFKLGFAEALAVLPPPTPKLSIAIISDETSWFNSYLKNLKFDLLSAGHKVAHVHNEGDLKPADLCFYLSFSKIVSHKTLQKFKNNLVAHSSDLPSGRGWSPLTWQILEDKKTVTTVLFEAEEDVDSGKIYLRQELNFSGYELIDELRLLQGNQIVIMLNEFIETYPEVLLRAQAQDGEASYYSKRRPVDSELNPDRSIREQLNLFRVADNSNYPVYTEIDQHFYELWIKKKDKK